MIWELYQRLREIALAEFGDVVIGAEVIVSHTGRARKLRVTLIDDTFVDVWYSEDRDYAYHWSSANGVILSIGTITLPTKRGESSRRFPNTAMKGPRRMSVKVTSLMSPRRQSVNFSDKSGVC